LNLEGNEVNSLPNEFVSLKKLKTLNLAKTNISSLPQNFGDLVNLETINLSYNPISAIPKSFSKLKKITKLYFYGDTALTSIDAITELTNLEYLNLGFTKISQLPNIKSLAKLDTLYLNDNQFEEIPNALPYNLKFLDISFNQITKINDNVAKSLSKLKKINLSGNNIDNLPFEMQLLKFEWTMADMEACIGKKQFELAKKIGTDLLADPSFKGQGELAWWFIQASDFENAKNSAETYVKNDASNVWYISNLGLAHLFLGEKEKAKEVFLKYKDMQYESSKLGKELFYADIKELLRAGIKPKKPQDVIDIIKILEVTYEKDRVELEELLGGKF